MHEVPIRRLDADTRTCPECGRVFDLMDETDAEEWFYGHDCEAPELHSPARAADPQQTPA